MRKLRCNSPTRCVAVALLLCAALLAPPSLIPPSLAQMPPTPPATDGPAFTLSYDNVLRVNADRTADYAETRRIKVTSLAAVRQVAQQTLQYVEGMQTFEITAAFTEKADGRKLQVDPATFITRDAATGLGAVYLRDLKVVTVIFPDVAVGDAMVLTTHKTVLHDTFPGHLEQLIPFPRTVPFADSKVEVIAPASLALEVAAQGEGMEQSSVTEGGEIRHLITYHARPAMLAEDRMTSPLDRDPRIAISTFADYEELGRSYWAEARGAIEATPEITRLADEITAGISDKRAQARAISHWVKANIRYVFVVLGATRVVPNPASAVLRNRYGDCKDHAVLTSALLAAKGIAVEHVLINGESAYTLPEPATMGYLNHVMLYLPELGLYDDPTQQFASFGVLAAAEYDKPVIHVSGARAYRAQTPAMKPEEHVSKRRTELAVAADGAVSGTTEQSGTGLFATNARAIAATLQGNGLERSAEDFLRRTGPPGKGRFEIDPLSELGDSYAVRARFTYDGRMTIKPPARFAILNGLGIQARPGEYLLAVRIPVRRQPFICLAGTQVEEIAITFADPLPLPQKIDGRRIDTKSFVYTADYQLDDRTLRVRRELISRVGGQVCPAELEAELAQPLRNVATSNATQMVFAAPAAAAPPSPAPTPPASEMLEFKRTATTDLPLYVDFLYWINPDCSSIGVASVRTIEEPKHGKLTVAKGTGFSSFPKENPRQACNRRRSEGMMMYYRPEPGYLGPDSVTVDVIYGDGNARKRHYAITVGPKPAPVEIARSAASEQRVRIGFLANVDPDCTSTPFANVRIVAPPQHGEATLSQDTGFTGYAKDNPRFECNQQRIDGTAVLYQSEAGYTGKDYLTVEIVYEDGRESNLRYAIEVK